MKRYFCTLFAKNYLLKGLSLYGSLKKHCDNFYLYILCMDTATYDFLNGVNLENVKLIKLSEFEDEKLLKIKNTRTLGEYCWTCTASLVLFLLKRNRDMDMISYVDADLFFFGDPEPIFAEFGGDSIFITEHNFSKEYRRLISNGKYNVQFLIFRNDPNAMEALEWWRQRTIEWCYGSRDGKKGGDQIYLDDWTARFKKVHVLRNGKICLAPWNATKYRITSIGNAVYVEDTRLIFYHFHLFKIKGMNKFKLIGGGFKLGGVLKTVVYGAYIAAVKEAIGFVGRNDPEFAYEYERENIKDSIKSSVKGLIYDFLRLKNT